jgi:hypothetical protein
VTDENGFSISYCSKLANSYGQYYNQGIKHSTEAKYTLDSGRTWKVYDKFPDEGSFYISDMCIVPGSDYLIMSTIYYREIFKTYLSKDKGETWLLLEEGTVARFMKFFDNQTGWAAWSGFTNLSPDGLTWDNKIYKYDGPPLQNITIIEDTINSWLKVFPNPTQKEVSISIDANVDKFLIQCIHASGRSFFITAVKNGNDTYVAEIDDIPSGIYFCKPILGHISKSFPLFILP